MRKIIYAVMMLVSLFVCGNVFAAKEQPVYTEDKLAVMASSDQPQFTLKLKSNPSTGYSWFLRDYDAKLITPIKHHYEASQDRKLIGAPGYDVWVFAVKPEGFSVPQQTLLRMVYARPWDVNDQSTQLIFRVSTIARSAE